MAHFLMMKMDCIHILLRQSYIWVEETQMCIKLEGVSKSLEEHLERDLKVFSLRLVMKRNNLMLLYQLQLDNLKICLLLRLQLEMVYTF